MTRQTTSFGTGLPELLPMNERFWDQEIPPASVVGYTLGVQDLQIKRKSIPQEKFRADPSSLCLNDHSAVEGLGRTGTVIWLNTTTTPNSSLPVSASSSSSSSWWSVQQQLQQARQCAFSTRMYPPEPYYSVGWIFVIGPIIPGDSHPACCHLFWIIGFPWVHPTLALSCVFAFLPATTCLMPSFLPSSLLLYNLPYVCVSHRPRTWRLVISLWGHGGRGDHTPGEIISLSPLSSEICYHLPVWGFACVAPRKGLGREEEEREGKSLLLFKGNKWTDRWRERPHTPWKSDHLFVPPAYPSIMLLAIARAEMLSFKFYTPHTLLPSVFFCLYEIPIQSHQVWKEMHDNLIFRRKGRNAKLCQMGGSFTSKSMSHI